MKLPAIFRPRSVNRSLALFGAAFRRVPSRLLHTFAQPQSQSHRHSSRRHHLPPVCSHTHHCAPQQPTTRAAASHRTHSSVHCRRIPFKHDAHHHVVKSRQRQHRDHLSEPSIRFCASSHHPQTAPNHRVIANPLIRHPTTGSSRCYVAHVRCQRPASGRASLLTRSFVSTFGLGASHCRGKGNYQFVSLLRLIIHLLAFICSALLCSASMRFASSGLDFASSSLPFPWLVSHPLH